LNAVELEPVETKVLNPNVSEASYKPKQRSYKKTKLIFFIFSFFSGGFGRGDFILEPYNQLLFNDEIKMARKPEKKQEDNPVGCIGEGKRLLVIFSSLKRFRSLEFSHLLFLYLFII